MVEGADGKRKLHSLSGNERNKLFLNSGTDFLDASKLSAMDNPADGRAFCYWDFDRDGWTDVAIINANDPVLNVYRNQIGALKNAQGNMLALRFVGGNESGNAIEKFTNRDGIGAKVTIELPDGTSLLREYRCGEGFAAQNSSTLVVGIGNNSTANKVTVRWPSGLSQSIENVAEGTLLTAFENVQKSSDGAGFDQQPYRKSIDFSALASSATVEKISVADSLGDGKIKVFTTMATWCPSCLEHLPQIADMKARMESAGLQLFAIPIDPTDTPSKLLTYQDEHSPEYRLLDDLSPEHRQEFETILQRHRADALPSSIITDANGNVLAVKRSLPTVSDIQKWISKTSKSPVSAPSAEN